MQPTRESFDRGFVLKAVIFSEALLLAVALLWMNIAGIDLRPQLGKLDVVLALSGIAVGMLTSLSSLGITILFQRKRKYLEWLSSLNELVQTKLAPLFKNATISDIIIISIASGFCEEFFFRGVLHEQFGAVVASIIFAMFHYAGPRYSIYVLWSFLAGLLFSCLLDLTGSLWVPIIAHMINNLTSIFILKARIEKLDNDDNRA